MTSGELPTENDFIAPDSDDLDERYALKTFLGKTPEEAKAMFRQDFLIYQMELPHMRPIAFRFYLIPAMNYLCSEAANGDADAVITFRQLIEARLNSDPEAIRSIAEIIRNTIERIVEDIDRFECEPEFDGDVRAKYRALLDRLNF